MLIPERFGEEVTVTMLDGSVQSNYLETVEIATKRKTPTIEASDTPTPSFYENFSTSLGNSMYLLLKTYDCAKFIYQGEFNKLKDLSKTLERKQITSLTLF